MYPDGSVKPLRQPNLYFDATLIEHNIQSTTGPHSVE